MDYDPGPEEQPEPPKLRLPPPPRQRWLREPDGVLLRYNGPAMHPTPTKSAAYEVFSCRQCGALVCFSDKGLHETWHQQLWDLLRPLAIDFLKRTS